MRRKLDHTRLAEGEVTGHYHEVVGDEVALYDDDTVEVPRGATVHHQEHKPVVIPPGEYERRIVQEFDHPEMSARGVQD
jgi:hypothetical protein